MQGRLNQTIEEIILKVNTAKAIKSSVQGHNAQMSIWTHLSTVIYVERGDNHLFPFMSVTECCEVKSGKYPSYCSNASPIRPTCSLHLVLLCALSLPCILCINSFTNLRHQTNCQVLSIKARDAHTARYAASYHQEDQLQTEVYVEFDLNR